MCKLCDVVFKVRIYMQVKNDLEAKVLCLTAVGLIKLQCSQLDEVKVSDHVCTILYFTLVLQ